MLITKARRVWGAKLRRSRKGANPTVPSMSLIFFSRFGRQNDARAVLTSVACGLDSPRLKDCPGLGDPNTLKKLNLNYPSKEP